MPTKVRCPNPQCGQSYSIDSGQIARKGRCKKCGTVFGLSSSVDGSNDGQSSPAAADSRDSAVAQRLGRFVIRDPLGSGAFGMVYRAFDPSLDREVALKVPHAGRLDSSKATERFLREARAAARLRHPHIVPLYETGLDNGRHYIASAYIDGTTLADIIEPGGVGSTRAAKITLQLAEALHYAHSEKIVHRDVKPSNVMLDARGEAHLMDFGLARFELSEERITQDGAILGTPAYMAPEQASGRSAEANALSDQYSLGVTLYELLCGQTPFSGPPEVVLFQVTQKQPESPRAVNSKVPRDLETICLKAMAKSPEHRYADCGEFGDDLRRWLMDEPIRARRQTLLERAWRWSRRNKVVAGLEAAVALSLTTVAVVATIQEQRAQYHRGLAEKAQEEVKAALSEAERQRTAAQSTSERLVVEQGQTKLALEDATKQKKLAEESAGKLEQEQRQTRAALEQSERLLCKALFDRGVSLCHDGDTQRGVLWMARSLITAKRVGLPEMERVVRLNLSSWIPAISRLKGTFEHKQAFSVALHPDGSTVALGLGSGGVLIYDVNTGQSTGPPLAHEEGITGLKYSPDGSKILTGSWDGNARLWDVTSSKVIHKLKPESRVLSVGFSSAGDLLMTASENIVVFWNAKTGRKVRSLSARSLNSNLGTISCDGKTMLLERPDGSGQLWNLTADRPVGNPLRHRAPIIAASFSPDGERVITGSKDHTARVWDVRTGETIGNSLVHQDNVISVAFSPDGKLALTGSDDLTARIWDSTTGEPIGHPLPHRSKVIDLGFSQDGSKLLTASDLDLRVWDFRAGEKNEPTLLQTTLDGGFVNAPHEILAVAISSDATIAMTGGGGGAEVWDATTGSRIGAPVLMKQQIVRHAAVSADGPTVVFGGQSYTVGQDSLARIFTKIPGAVPETTVPHKTHIYAVAVSADGLTAFTGSYAGIAQLTDVRSGKTITCRFDPGKAIRSAAFSGDGTVVIAGSDHCVGGWNAKTGDPVRPPMNVGGHGIFAVAVSHDGATFLTGSQLGEVMHWDLKTGSPVGQPMKHQDAIRVLAFSRDDSTVLTGSDDNTARLWAAKTGLPIGQPMYHEGAVGAVAFSPDGGIAVTGSAAGARYWDARTGEPVGTTVTDRGRIRISSRYPKVALSADGSAGVFGGEAGAALFRSRFPTPLPGTPEQIMTWLTTITGVELSAAGTYLNLNSRQLAEHRQRLQQLGGFPVP